MNKTPTLDDYVHRYHEVIRWGDMDAFSHVNNVAFFRYLESARVEYALTVLSDKVRAEGENIILADLRCTFQRQIKWPGQVTIYTRTVRVGRTSMTLHQLMCIADTPTVAATAETVLVWFDFLTQQPAPVPDSIRARLAEYEHTPPAGLETGRG